MRSAYVKRAFEISEATVASQSERAHNKTEELIEEVRWQAAELLQLNITDYPAS